MEFRQPFWTGSAVGAVVTALIFITVGTFQHHKASVDGIRVKTASAVGSGSSEADLPSLTKEIRSALSISVDGGNYDPLALAKVTAEVINKGFGRAEAVTMIEQFAKTGVEPELVSDMSFTASTLANVTRSDLTMTANEIANGVTRGYQACFELDQKFNFMTAEQSSQIHDEFDSGGTGEARADCFRALHARALIAAKSGG